MKPHIRVLIRYISNPDSDIKINGQIADVVGVILRLALSGVGGKCLLDRWTGKIAASKVSTMAADVRRICNPVATAYSTVIIPL